jgi:WD40 repeat protein
VRDRHQEAPEQPLDITTGREIRTLSGHSDALLSVAFSLDGKQVVSGSFEKTIKL